MHEQRIADEGPEKLSAESGRAPVPSDRARRTEGSAVVDEWLRRQVRRLLDQVGALPSPAFMRLERSMKVAVGADRSVRVVAALVFFLLLLALGFAISQWRAARAAESAATAQLRRTADARDFLSEVLRAAAGSSIADPAQRPRMKDVLDAATPHVVQRFANEPTTQGELLGLVAAMYRDIGDHESRRALLALQRVALRRVHGEAHPAVIGSLLDEAQAELARSELDAAAARLVEADPLITRAGLDDGALRGRWWMLRSDTLADASDRTQALDRAIAAFERQQPVDPTLGEALSRKAWRLLSTHPAQSEILFERAAAAMDDRDGAQRRAVFLGLAQAHEGQGEYDAALAALDQARTLGPRQMVAEAHYAWALHREGERERAHELFDALLAGFTPASQTVVSEESITRAYYAECLAAEGRPMQAIPLFEAIGSPSAPSGHEGPDRQRALLGLGDAYDRAGLWWKARDAIKEALDRRLADASANDAHVAEAHERWGRFLLGRNSIDDARAQFDLVLDRSDERNLERVVLAYGGLARVALARHDWDAALTASTHAVVGFENLVGPRDVRTGPYLWLIHAEALRNVDDHASARIWATRALEASRRYDVPNAASIRDAEAMMSRLLD